MKAIALILVFAVAVALVSSDSGSESGERAHMKCQKTAELDACCWFKAYNSTTQYCCKHEVMDKQTPGNNACCGRNPYDSTQQTCCIVKNNFQLVSGTSCPTK